MTNEGTPDMHKNIFKKNKPKMAYSRDAFIETREDREKERRERLLIDCRKTGKMAYHRLTIYLDRARES